MIHTIKGFTVVHEAEVDVFLEFPCFFFRKSEQVIPAVTHLSVQQGSPHSSDGGAGRSGSDREDLPSDTEAQGKDWTEGEIFRIEGRPVKGPEVQAGWGQGRAEFREEGPEAAGFHN